MPQTGRRALIAASLSMPFVARHALAAWPDRPLRMVVPFTPGGSTDILGRAMAQRLGEVFGQPFVVENRAGAGGTVGSEVVARAAPDGLTWMMGHIGTLAVNPAIYPNLSFDIATAFQPVVLVAKVANVLVVHPNLPARNVQELLELARRRRGEITYGSGGNGSAAHIATLAMMDVTGVQLTHVPYRGTGPMMTDLIAGTLDMTMTGGPPALPPARSGQLRALGVSSLQRIGAAPELPTLAESGIPGFEAVQWYGIVAPAGTPREMVDRVNAESAKILAEPVLQQRLASEGADAAAGTPESFGEFIRTERERWGALIRKAGVRPD
ncbi:Bug family tripartite tricarboxylate transporter substrate binding protein [Muricoccus radiodurans]|uniref:Bug family tripartite tricarboxylate transporter substrate binding protein n=1 Tax=Muricoccus radiodurans TaxID=2231721 RepID=UPI003CF193A7